METTRHSFAQDIFKLEQNVMEKKNLDALYQIAHDRIAEQILAYICYDHQYNLLGYGTIDSDTFAEMCGYSTSYLRQAHENPFQLQLSNLSKKPERNGQKRSVEAFNSSRFVCETRLENAVFILANLPLEGSYISIEDDQKYVRKFLPFRAIERFTITREKGRGGKLKIHYQLTNEFRRNLSFYYRNASMEAIKNLRATGLNPMYFYLLKLRDSLYAEGRSSTTPDYTPRFETLCEKADISKNLEPKYQKRKLKAVFNTINERTLLHFTVEWITSESNGEKYTPIFNFIPGFEDIILTPDTRRAVNVKRSIERKNTVANEFGHALVELYISRHGNIEDMLDDNFFDWIKKDDQQTLRSIAMVMQKAFVDTGNKIPGDIDRRVAMFNHYANNKDKEEFQDWLSDIFSGDFEPIIPMKIIVEESNS